MEFSCILLANRFLFWIKISGLRGKYFMKRDLVAKDNDHLYRQPDFHHKTDKQDEKWMISKKILRFLKAFNFLPKILKMTAFRVKKLGSLQCVALTPVCIKPGL